MNKQIKVKVLFGDQIQNQHYKAKEALMDADEQT